MVLGLDVSHWNSIGVAMEQIEANKLQFLIAKATEGKTYQDIAYANWKQIAEHYGMIFGSYHFAKPKNNKPLEEAHNFLATITEKNQILALDWEADALKCDVKWAKEWLDIVYAQTGIKPLFYTSSSYATKCDIIAEADYGLWVADYTPPINSIGKWKTYAIHQYTSTPIDLDKFNGTFDQLIKYTIPDGQKICPTCGRPL